MAAHPCCTGEDVEAGSAGPACRLAGLSALGAHYAGVKWRTQCGPTRSPTRPRPRVTAGPCASRRRQGAFLPNTPRAAPQRPRAQKARPSASYKRPNAATGAATTTSSFHQNSYHICYYRSIGAIFLTAGFQATIRLPEVPPPPPSWRSDFYRLLLFRLAECPRGISPWHTENESPQWAHGPVHRKATGVFSSGGDEVAI